MKEHVNFYENLKESLMRLRGTVVLYDGMPHYVITMANHKIDGIIRVYMEEIGLSDADIKVNAQFHQIVREYNPEFPGSGDLFDKWLEDNKGHKIIRKMMNSPKFNKFRPFPLGMCNIKGEGAYYLERMPRRETHQGLTNQMIYQHLICTNGDRKENSRRFEGPFDIRGAAFRSCVLGEHPTAQECLSNLLDPDVTNDAAAFDRNFALVRGPINMMFLAYQADIIGVLPKNNFEYFRLGREFIHCKEVVSELGLFANIMM
jgi:hypothetical protein